MKLELLERERGWNGRKRNGDSLERWELERWWNGNGLERERGGTGIPWNGGNGNGGGRISPGSPAVRQLPGTTDSTELNCCDLDSTDTD